MPAIDVAKRFARSLDQADYAVTAECLAAACQYEVAEKVNTGPDAILASYRDSGDWAARTLDGIRYESNVRLGEGGAVVVEFIDHLEHAGVSHIDRCQQHLTFDERVLIFHIKHIDLPGEQEALDRFFTAVGLSRSTPATSSSDRVLTSTGVKTMATKTSKKSAKVSRPGTQKTDQPIRERGDSKTAAKIRFSAKLHRPATTAKPVSGAAGGWTFLTLPKEASAKLPSRSMASVEGTLNGCTFAATLEPDGQGGHWLKVDRKLREAAGAQAGDLVTLEIAPVAPDQEPEPKVPADLRKALATAQQRAKAVWSDITPMARRDFVHWVVSAKQAETRARRVEKACDMLAKGKRRPCCFDRSGMYDKSLSCPVALEAEE